MLRVRAGLVSAKSRFSRIKLSLILNSGFQLLQKLRILAQMTGVDVWIQPVDATH